MFHLLKAASLLALLAAGDSALQQVRAHGSAGGEEPLPPGEFRAIPVITIEGHGGFENNLEGHPEHYAIDGQFGVVLEWGLPNDGSFAIEAALGPALVWGEAEHFYGRVHVESGDHGDRRDRGVLLRPSVLCGRVGASRARARVLIRMVHDCV